MPAENTTLYAKWNAGEVNYTVNYYLQNVDGTVTYCKILCPVPTRLVRP